jgi:hypothetical protein
MEKQQPEAPITGPELTEVQYVKVNKHLVIYTANL